MAKHKRKPTTGKPARGKPITSHPLFPAVVALWFGALFGLGSLAIRPALIEGAVMASRVDLLVPAAAPPLGMTARILMALGLAAGGALLGAVLARRIARPKVVAQPRRRNAMPGADSIESPHHHAYLDHPAFAADDDFGAGDFGQSGGFASQGALPGRRRALAIEEREDDFVPHDAAPLPGGSPQILDIARITLRDSDAEPAHQPTGPLDLDGFMERPAPAPAEQTAAQTAPVENRQVFRGHAEPESGPEPEIDLTGRQVFGQASVPPPETETRQIFGVTATDGQVPQDFVKAHGYQTTVFDTPEPAPLFAGREPFAPVETPVEAPVIAAAPAEPAPPAALPPAAPPPAAPQPAIASLGMIDLAARLGESMQRRRAAALAPAPPEAVALAAAPAPANTLQPASVLQPTSTLQPTSPAAPPLERFPSINDLPPPPFAAQAPVPPVPPAPIAMPAALRPIAFDDHVDDDDTLASLLPPRRMAMPPQDATPAEPLDLSADESLSDALEEEDNYASLLTLGAPLAETPQFVRIAEPEPQGQAIEPVVIFPGQSVPGLAAAPVAETVPFRRFDSPASAGHGQPVATTPGDSLIDPAEAERSLRAALANLQRISGAA